MTSTATETRQLTVTYGDHECCDEAPAYVVTRTDATGTITYRVCTEHRDECAATASRYVGGWGAFTLSVAKLADDVAVTVTVPRRLASAVGDAIALYVDGGNDTGAFALVAAAQEFHMAAIR
jgi:hypothetical protein